MVESADHEVLGIFDILVNGVLVHSRKCDTHVYGVHRQQWLRDSCERKNAVWYAIKSLRPEVGSTCSSNVCTTDDSKTHCQAVPHGGLEREQARVVVRHSQWYGHQAELSVQLLKEWFPTHSVDVRQREGTESDEPFSIAVNGVLLHSRQLMGHGFFHNEWEQQDLVWKAVKGFLGLHCHGALGSSRRS